MNYWRCFWPTTILILMANTTTKYLVLQWELSWHLHMPTCYDQIWTKSYLHISSTAHTMKEIYRWYLHDLASWYGFTIGIHRILKPCTPNYQIHKHYLPNRSIISDLIIYIRGDKLYTRLHTKSTDRHMYLNFFSEHPMNLKRSIPYCQFSQTQENTFWVTLSATGTNPTLLVL